MPSHPPVQFPLCVSKVVDEKEENSGAHIAKVGNVIKTLASCDLLVCNFLGLACVTLIRSSLQLSTSLVQTTR